MVILVLPLWGKGATIEQSCPPRSLSSADCPSLGALTKPSDLESMADTPTPSWRMAGGILSPHFLRCWNAEMHPQVRPR